MTVRGQGVERITEVCSERRSRDMRSCGGEEIRGEEPVTRKKRVPVEEKIQRKRERMWIMERETAGEDAAD